MSGWMTMVVREATRQGRLDELCYCAVINYPDWLELGVREDFWEEYPKVVLIFPLHPDPSSALADCSEYCMGLRLDFIGSSVLFRVHLMGINDFGMYDLYTMTSEDL